jgi:flagellar biosynthetic protein FlhB
MAEEQAQEKTELPTQRRLDQAMEEGRVPRSQELSAAIVLLAGATALAAFGGTALGEGSFAILRGTASALSGPELTEAGAAALLRTMTSSMLSALAPFLLAVALPVVAINAIQARGVLSLKPVTPQLSRISPLAGLGRLLSVQSLFTLGKAIVKLLVIGYVTWIALMGAWPELSGLIGAPAPAVLATTRTITIRLVLFAVGAFAAVAVVDYLFEAWRHQKELRMTRREIFDELRESEGDPMLRSRRRSLAQSFARRRMLQQVKSADVVIVNPTEIAIAIRYDGRKSVAPVVVAMGQRKLAERIRAIAREAGVPIVRNVPVARALLAGARIGQPIPPALYAAVAEVLAFVYRVRGRLPQHLAEARRA